MKFQVLTALVVVAGLAAVWLFQSTPAPTFEVPKEAPSTFAPAPTVLLSKPGTGEVLRRLEVDGMCCKGCTGKLHKALVDFPGVREAAVDFETSLASMIVRDDIAVDALEQLLSFDKYSAKALP